MANFNHISPTSIAATPVRNNTRTPNGPALHTSQPNAIAPTNGTGTKDFLVETISCTSQEATFDPPPRQTSRQTGWKGSLIRAGPLAGIASLTFGALAILASFAVLKASDHEPVASWTYQPTVYLAILTAISNKALAFAAIQGTVVSWWLRAVRGTSLGQLHRDWGMGLHVYKALAAGRHGNILAIACILATLVAIDGPLLQRASSVVGVTPQYHVTLSVSLAPELPHYWSGWSRFEEGQTVSAEFSPDFTTLFGEYSQQAPIVGVVSGCPYQKCTLTVRAPFLAVDSCETSSIYINYMQPFTKVEKKILQDNAFPENRTAFGIHFTTFEGTYEILGLRTLLSDAAVAENCNGSLVVTTCGYRSAVGEYDIAVEDGKVKLAADLSAPRLVAYANNSAISSEVITKLNLTNEDSTLAGLAVAGMLQFGMNVGLIPIGQNQSGIESQGNNWFAFQHMTNRDDTLTGKACGAAWRDPTPEILSSLNEVTFRAGAYVAAHHDEEWLRSRLDPSLESRYNANGRSDSQILVYRSNFSYFVGAAVVQAVTIAVIAYNFYGFWRLGRNTTFSPLEIAHAFDAPLLQHEPSNMSAARLAKSCGDVEVQYGIPVPKAEHQVETTELLLFGEQRAIQPLVGQGRIASAFAKLRLLV